MKIIMEIEEGNSWREEIENIGMVVMEIIMGILGIIIWAII